MLTKMLFSAKRKFPIPQWKLLLHLLSFAKRYYSFGYFNDNFNLTWLAFVVVYDCSLNEDFTWYAFFF